MVYDIVYSEDSSILIRTFKGTVRFTEVIESWNYLVRSDMVEPGVIGILNDFTNAELEMDRKNLDHLMDFFQSYEEIFTRIKLAVVMVTPKNIILPILASQHFPQFRIRAFSTSAAAEKWIRSDQA